MAGSPNLPTVEGDPQRLLQVLQNLISNAMKFMGSQDRPRIELEARREGPDTGGPDPGDPDVVFYVRDNGVGIELHDRERIFGLFDKLNPEVEGSGIGLALVQRIVEAHGGRIWVESEGSGRGSTLCFTLQRDLDQAWLP